MRALRSLLILSLMVACNGSDGSSSKDMTAVDGDGCEVGADCSIGFRDAGPDSQVTDASSGEDAETSVHDDAYTGDDLSASDSLDTTVPPPITGASIQDHYMVFADGMLISGETPDERRVELGTFYFGPGNTVTAAYALYDRNESLPAYTSSVQHNEMDAALVPYKGPNGAPGVFQTPNPTSVVNEVGTWSFSDNQLYIHIGSAIRVWVVADNALQMLQPLEITNDQGGYTFPDGRTFYSLAGYGFLTGENPTSTNGLTHQAMSAVNYYEHYHLAPADTAWQFFPSVWRPATAWQAQGNPDVVSVTNSSTLTCGAYSMATYDGMLFNLDSNKSTFYSNDGHDYNCDGYFNDGGHIKRWLAVRESGVVRRTVFIEYSSTGGGYVSVGRWNE